MKEFPPGRGYVKLPTSSRADALAGIAVYSASRPAALWAQRAAWGLVRLLGPHALPGRARAWVTPLPEPEWQGLLAVLADTVGGFDALAAYQPRQTTRSGFCLLLLRGRVSVGFVKVRPDEGGRLANEQTALDRICAFRPAGFRVPEPVAAGSFEGWRYLVTRALPPRLHRPPVAPPIEAITGEIVAALETLPRPAELPAHWRPMHGDFTPWNLRESGYGLFLIDWEDAGWAPPRADELYYRATESALRRRPPAPVDAPEAAGFWWDRVAGRAPSIEDEPLRRGMLDALRALGATDVQPSAQQMRARP
jgi:hypothetical protein